MNIGSSAEILLIAILIASSERLSSFRYASAAESGPVPSAEYLNDRQGRGWK